MSGPNATRFRTRYSAVADLDYNSPKVYHPTAPSTSNDKSGISIQASPPPFSTWKRNRLEDSSCARPHGSRPSAFARCYWAAPSRKWRRLARACVRRYARTGFTTSLPSSTGYRSDAPIRRNRHSARPLPYAASRASSGLQSASPRSISDAYPRGRQGNGPLTKLSAREVRSTRRTVPR